MRLSTQQTLSPHIVRASNSRSMCQIVLLKGRGEINPGMLKWLVALPSEICEKNKRDMTQASQFPPRGSKLERYGA